MIHYCLPVNMVNGYVANVTVLLRPLAGGEGPPTLLSWPFGPHCSYGSQGLTHYRVGNATCGMANGISN